MAIILGNTYLNTNGDVRRISTQDRETNPRKRLFPIVTGKANRFRTMVGDIYDGEGRCVFAAAQGSTEPLVDDVVIPFKDAFDFWSNRIKEVGENHNPELLNNMVKRRRMWQILAETEK